MEKYKCIKEFELPICDEDGSPTDDYHKVHISSIYEYQPDYRGESQVRMYLETGDDDFGYIDITFEHLEEKSIITENAPQEWIERSNLYRICT